MLSKSRAGRQYQLSASALCILCREEQKREPVKFVFKKTRKKFDGEFEMVSVSLWHNEHLNQKSPS